MVYSVEILNHASTEPAGIKIKRKFILLYNKFNSVWGKLNPEQNFANNDATGILTNSVINSIESPDSGTHFANEIKFYIPLSIMLK